LAVDVIGFYLQAIASEPGRNSGMNSIFSLKNTWWIVLLLGSNLVFAQKGAVNDKELEQQQSTRSDHDLVNEIRNAIHEDTSLSPEAQKLKVAAEAGQVTLKGTVQSEEEKQAIEAKAQALAGQRKISNQLTVKLKD